MDHEQFEKQNLLKPARMVCAAAILSTSEANAADGLCALPGREDYLARRGSERYDFTMDDATGGITPMTAPASEVTSFGIDVSLKGRVNAAASSWFRKGCARQSVVMARLLLESSASNGGRVAETRFSHRLRRALTPAIRASRGTCGTSS